MRHTVLNIFLALLLVLGARSQQRSISGGQRKFRRNQLPAGKSRVNFICPEDFGYYPHPSDCSQYYVCVFGGALQEACTGGLMYSRKLQTCDWPRNAGCDRGGPSKGISTVEITDPRTSRVTNQINAATEPFPSSASRRRGIDNAIPTRGSNKPSVLISRFDNPSKSRQGRFLSSQGLEGQNVNTGFQAQETSSRSFNVVPSTGTKSRGAFSSSIPSTTRQRFSTTGKEATKADDYYYYYDDIIYDDYFDPVVEPKTVSRTPSRTSSRSPTTTSQQRSKSVQAPSTSGRRNLPTKSIFSTSFSATPLLSASSSSRSSPASSSSAATRGTTRARSRSPKKASISSSSQSKKKASQGGTPKLTGKTPTRPRPTRAQPPVGSVATTCDRKVCNIPDCYCGGGPIPGGLSPETVPQLVLLTFDDSINDLNKKLYEELFHRGRKNPNGCPISSTMYVSHEWTDYSQVQNLYADGHEIASHSITHSFGEQFSAKKWGLEIQGQREILSAYGGVRMEDVRGMRAPFLAIGGNKMFEMLYHLNFTYDSSMPVYSNNPPSWPYTLDNKVFHDCMIPPCPTKSYPGVWEVPMVMWQDLVGGRCSMADACTSPGDANGVYDMLIKNFERHYTTNRSPFGLFYHAAWFTKKHHKEGFIAFLDAITALDDVWLVTNWQALQWVRNPVPISQANSFRPFQCDYPERPPRCSSPRVCNVWHKGSERYMKTCQSCPVSYPWTGKTGVPSPLNQI